MLLRDPHVGVNVDMAGRKSLQVDGQFVAVESIQPSRWFLSYTPTGETFKFDDVNEEVRLAAEQALSGHYVQCVVEDACELARAEGVTEANPDEVREARQHFVEMFGEVALVREEGRARARGHALSEVHAGYVLLTSEVEPPLPEEISLADVFAPQINEGLYDKYLMKAIVLAGAGGSGKSGVADAMFSGLGLKIINTDKNLERFMKHAGEELTDVGKHYGDFVKARDLAQTELRHYAQRRLGLIIDGTGWRYDRVANPVRKLRKLGYDVFMVYVDVPLEVALKRNRERGEKGGRFVPDSFIEDAWYGVRRNLKNYVKLFGKKNIHMIVNDTAVDPADWAKKVAPKLRALGMKIINRPLKNPKGIEWLKKQQDPETRTLDKPGANEWPKPKPQPVYKPKGKKGMGKSAAEFAAKFADLPKKDIKPTGKTHGVYKPYRPISFDWAQPVESLYHRGTGADGGGAACIAPHNDADALTSAFPTRDTVSLPIPLDEKKAPKDDFRVRLKITPEKSHPENEVNSIGKSATNGKWYGWSHRAYHGFKVGDKFFPKLTFHTDWPLEKQDAWEKEQRAKADKIKSEAEAKQSAINFADWVS